MLHQQTTEKAFSTCDFYPEYRERIGDIKRSSRGGGSYSWGGDEGQLESFREWVGQSGGVKMTEDSAVLKRNSTKDGRQDAAVLDF